MQRDVHCEATAAKSLTNVNELSVIDLSIDWVILVERRTMKSIRGH